MKPSMADAIGFLVLVCVAGSGYFGLIQRQNHKLKDAKAAVAELTRTTLSNEGLENMLTHDVDDMQPFRERLDKYSEAFVGRKSIDEFLRRFAADADEAGVSVNLLRPGEVRQESWYNLTPINVDLEGSFAGIYSVVRTLEAGSSMTIIERMRILSDFGSESCRASITFNLYHLWAGNENSPLQFNSVSNGGA